MIFAQEFARPESSVCVTCPFSIRPREDRSEWRDCRARTAKIVRKNAKKDFCFARKKCPPCSFQLRFFSLCRWIFWAEFSWINRMLGANPFFFFVTSNSLMRQACKSVNKFTNEGLRSFLCPLAEGSHLTQSLSWELTVCTLFVFSLFYIMESLPALTWLKGSQMIYWLGLIFTRNRDEWNKSGKGARPKIQIANQRPIVVALLNKCHGRKRSHRK